MDDFNKAIEENNKPVKKSIFQMTNEYVKLEQELIENGGELTEDLERALAINRNELETKSKSYIAVIKKIGSNIDYISEEVKRLQALKKVQENAQNRLKTAISDSMEAYGVDELDFITDKINFRKSESVEIQDIELLPSDCVIIEKKHISKTDLKRRIKSGEEIPGAKLISNRKIQIK